MNGTQKSDSVKLDDIHENFHTYAMQWTPEKM